MSSAIGQLWISTSNGSTKARVVVWPNGLPCWEVNCFLASLQRRGRSASTVRAYASELSSAVRFVFSRSLDFLELHDQDIVDYSRWLASNATGRTRQNNQVNKLLDRLLTFLRWLQTFSGLEQPLVGAVGSGAKVSVEETVLRIRGRSTIKSRHLGHVPSNATWPVRPVARATLVALRNSVATSYKSPYCRARAHALLTLLADTGCRREEAVYLRVEDVRSALEDDRGLLRLRTSKRPGNPGRYVPIPRTSLVSLQQFIDVQRALLVRRLTKLKRRPAEWVLLSRRGDMWDPESVTQCFARLRRCGQVSGRASAHMLRHRWITLQLLERLKRCQEVALGPELATTMLTRVASMSGHSDIDSLWDYVDFSFEEFLSEDVEREVDLVAELDAMEGLIRSIGDVQGDDASFGKLASSLLTTIERIRSAPAKLPKEALSAHSFRRP